MRTLGKRLTALEEIAEQCRRRERDAILADEIQRRSDRPLGPVELVGQVARASALADKLEAWDREGLSLAAMARRAASECGLDPDRVVTILADLRLKYGR